MGATLIDGILQAGLNYKNVVKPRVDKFKSEYKDVKTTTDFYNLMNEKDISQIIDFKGDKIERLKLIVNFLKNEKVETEDDLYEWLSIKENTLALSNLKGIKEKTIDYLKILSGHKDTVAIDVRLISFIKKACPDLETISYDYAKELLLKTAEKLKIAPATLDYSIWAYESGLNAKN
jgi:thermostable 8-oxoguanine DNA glycosylase